MIAQSGFLIQLWCYNLEVRASTKKPGSIIQEPVQCFIIICLMSLTYFSLNQSVCPLQYTVYIFVLRPADVYSSLAENKPQIFCLLLFWIMFALNYLSAAVQGNSSASFKSYKITFPPQCYRLKAQSSEPHTAQQRLEASGSGLTRYWFCFYHMICWHLQKCTISAAPSSVICLCPGSNGTMPCSFGQFQATFLWSNTEAYML